MFLCILKCVLVENDIKNAKKRSIKMYVKFLQSKFEKYLKMSLQATLIMLDNSSYALNGDYLPTRWEGQVDAASLLIQAKLQANMQSSVGLGLMGGRQVEILCTMTSDSTKVSSFLFGCKVHGQLHFTQALQVGALALKHRSNQTQKQRMVCFVGSTIQQDCETLKILGKKLKKNNIAVDLICFGDVSQQQKNKVETFIKAIQHEQNSKSMFIEPGEVYLSDKLLGSKIFNGGEAGGNAPGGAMGGMGGIQEDDPELAEAIRQSLLQSQQQQQQAPPANQQKKEQNPQNAQNQPDEEQLQRLAIQMSLQQMNEEKDDKDKKKDEQKKQ